jgi:hypothetical protein
MNRNEFITTTSVRLLCSAIASGQRSFVADAAKTAVQLTEELEKMGVAPWIASEKPR